MNEFLATGPFDLYELQLFHLVAEHQNFTRAGREAGLTQSAMTRQIQGMEERLGTRLFDRTTRSVRLTPAGAALHARSGVILDQVQDAVAALKSDFDLAPQTLRVGIARSIGMSYLPGFFHRFQKRFPKIQLHVAHESSSFILAAVESGELEVGVVSAPSQLSRGLQVTHRFQDEFVAIFPPKSKLTRPGARSCTPAELAHAAPSARWLLISEQTSTGRRLRHWLEKNQARLQASMHADNFDLIVNLVSLGLGASLVPHRILALHGNRRPVQRLTLKPKFTRELIVVVRKQDSPRPRAIAGFIDNILF